jgi:hypothetical protein
VIGPCIAEVVRFTGGWLFDQVMAGWDVTVLNADNADSRPLRILGARSADLESGLTRVVQVPCLQTIALRADLYGQDERIRQLVLATAADNHADIRLWGDPWPAGLDDTAGPVQQHQLSVAARAFKAQALAATAEPGSAADPGVTADPAGTAAEAEVFRRFRAVPAGSDGDPASSSAAERRGDLRREAPVPAR